MKQMHNGGPAEQYQPRHQETKTADSMRAQKIGAAVVAGLAIGVGAGTLAAEAVDHGRDVYNNFSNEQEVRADFRAAEAALHELEADDAIAISGIHVEQDGRYGEFISIELDRSMSDEQREAHAPGDSDKEYLRWIGFGNDAAYVDWEASLGLTTDEGKSQERLFADRAMVEVPESPGRHVIELSYIMDASVERNWYQPSVELALPWGEQHKIVETEPFGEVIVDVDDNGALEAVASKLYSETE